MQTRVRSTIAALFLLPAISAAQYSEQSPSLIRGYMLYGNSYRGFPGGPKKHNLDMGVDLPWKRLWVGLEMGIRGGGSSPPGCEPRYSYSEYSYNEDHCDTEVSLSTNGSYYFNLGPKLNWLEPFVTGGYTLSTRFDPSYKFHFPNYGGGANFWFTGNSRVGLRLEVRDHLAVQEGVTHLPEFRIGVVVR